MNSHYAINVSECRYQNVDWRVDIIS